MNKKALENRLRELSLYSEYYLRKELKPLSQLIKNGETLNCILTGVHEANRKMVAVTDQRILIIFAGALGSGEFKVVKRNAVKEYWFRKKILFSSFGFSTEGGEEFVFTNTQGSMKSLFEWAMAQPVPSGV